MEKTKKIELRRTLVLYSINQLFLGSGYHAGLDGNIFYIFFVVSFPSCIFQVLNGVAFQSNGCRYYQYTNCDSLGGLL